MLIETEDTGDPGTMSFLPGRPVLEAGTVAFEDAAAAEGSPLARRLFETGSVARVVLEPDAVRVTKAADADWRDLKTAVLQGIIEHFLSGDPAVAVPAEQEAEQDAGDGLEFEPESNPVVAEVRELIEARIRPGVMQSGGDVSFRGYRGGVVYLEMQGAAFSLKDSIGQMLRHYVPEVTEVRDYQDAAPKPGLKTPEGLAIQQVLDERINPSIAAHGGHISLVDVQADTAYIRLEGGCQGCGMADVTLKQGVEHEIKRAAAAITTVLDTTDHAGGANPYYQPGKGGASPF